MSTSHARALDAVYVVMAEVDRRAQAASRSVDPLGRDLLAVLLGPDGRALLPDASSVVARLLVHHCDSAQRAVTGRSTTAAASR